MGRIRTIKPEFFTHEALFDAEAETGLPLRLAFAGLWTQSDREGRFLWRPRTLKSAIMPFDQVDFARVLDALLTRGFLVRYVSEAREVGAVPSFGRHQVINHRESASTLPAAPENADEIDAWATREARVEHAARGEGKGREGKEETPDGVSSPETAVSGGKPKALTKKRQSYPEAFEAAWKAYPTTANMSKAEGHKAWAKLDDEDRQKVAKAIPGFVAYCKAHPDYPPIYFERFIRQRRFDGYAEVAGSSAPAEADWRRRLIYARDRRTWSVADWGPIPGHDGCQVPPALLMAGDGEGWSNYQPQRAPTPPRPTERPYRVLGTDDVPPVLPVTSEQPHG